MERLRTKSMLAEISNQAVLQNGAAFQSKKWKSQDEKYTFAVVGALGNIGTEMRNILETSDLPIGNLILMDLAQNADKKVSWRSNEYTVIEAKAESFTG